MRRRLKTAGGKELGMDVQIRIAGGTGEELAALGQWLGSEDELRGRVRTVRGTIGETELGAVTELLTVALGAGGAGTVLTSSLKTWLVTRRTTAKITVESTKGTVTFDIQTFGEMAPLLEQILKADDDD
jgi:Effector Associated Constant Component 1